METIVNRIMLDVNSWVVRFSHTTAYQHFLHLNQSNDPRHIRIRSICPSLFIKTVSGSESLMCGATVQHEIYKYAKRFCNENRKDDLLLLEDIVKNDVTLDFDDEIEIKY